MLQLLNIVNTYVWIKNFSKKILIMHTLPMEQKTQYFYNERTNWVFDPIIFLLCQDDAVDLANKKLALSLQH